MTIERTSVASLLASLLLLAGLASGQDFNERFAAWQGRAPVTQRMAAPSMPPQEMVSQTETILPPTTSRSQRIPAAAYSTSMPSTIASGPVVTSGCASCAHQSMSALTSDPLGGYDFGGGGGCGSCGFDGCGACGPCGPCGACGGAGGGCDWGDMCSNPLVWARFEVLLWWRQGRDFPPIITTDPTTESSTTAGVLPDAQILFGNDRVGSTMQAGGRADFGFFTSPMQCFGIGDRVWGLGKDALNFHVSSNNVPVLAIPFRDFTSGNNDALLVAFPGLRSGSITVSGASSVFGNDVYGRFLLCRDCNCRLDFITGWNYTRVADEIRIGSRSTVTETGGNLPTGTVTTVVDQFEARNDFNGGILGLQWQRDCGCWTTQLLTRISIGNMHETMIINGSTRVAVPGQDPQTTRGGLFTADSNIGRFSRDEFTAITEIGYNISYRFAPCTQLTVGYSFIYWNDIATPGKSIDTAVGTSGGQTRPQFAFRHSDFWVQGLNLGLTKQF
jgi:Putative beta barrel porin-7 (BBP7)